MSSIRTTAIASVTFFSSILPAQSWEYDKVADTFTDEVVATASIDIELEEHTYSLFVNCRSSESLNIGLTGTYINPVGGVRVGDAELFNIPMRFDNDEPREEQLSKQGHVLFLTNPLLTLAVEGKPLFTPDESLEITGRVTQIFVKKLAAHDRLRIRFPQYQQSIVLDFPLTGALSALLKLASECKIPAAGGTGAFVDSDGNEYATLIDMLNDKTWHDRITH